MREKFLTAAFPLDLHAERYAAETQFGHLYRPTHTNTSWEAAKFETCAHRFVHLEEPGWGVAIVNDSTYGHDVTRCVRPADAADGPGTTTVRLPLLRTPRYPDPETDQGRRRFRYALLPGADVGDAVREGYVINLPKRHVTGTAAAPLVALDDAVVLTALKLADDGSGDVVVRFFHEARGGRATATLTPDFPFSSVKTVDLLERPVSHGPVGERSGKGDTGLPAPLPDREPALGAGAWPDAGERRRLARPGQRQDDPRHRAPSARVLERRRPLRTRSPASLRRTASCRRAARTTARRYCRPRMVSRCRR